MVDHMTDIPVFSSDYPSEYATLYNTLASSCDHYSRSGDNAVWVGRGLNLMMATIELMAERCLLADFETLKETMTCDTLCRAAMDYRLSIGLRRRIQDVFSSIPGVPADLRDVVNEGGRKLKSYKSVRREFKALTLIVGALYNLSFPSPGRRRTRQTDEMAAPKPILP